MIHFWYCEQDKFLESMADAVKSVMDFRKDKIVFINVIHKQIKLEKENLNEKSSLQK